MILSDANLLIQKIKHERLQYILKSEGIFFYDFGFGPLHQKENYFTKEKCFVGRFALHVQCPFYAVFQDENIFISDGSTIEDLNLIIPQLCKKYVSQVEITNQNELILRFGNDAIIVTPYDDVESWRFFEVLPKSHHLVVSHNQITLS